MVESHNEVIPLFQVNYPNEYQEILDNFENIASFEESYLDKIPSWKDLYRETLSEIVTSKPNNVYFISACRVCSRNVVDVCPGDSSEINSTTIPDTDNPLTNFLKSIEVYDKLMNNTILEF